MILKINLKIVAGILGVLLLIASIPIGMRTISASTDHTITSEENTVELPILMYHHMPVSYTHLIKIKQIASLFTNILHNLPRVLRCASDDWHWINTLGICNHFTCFFQIWQCPSSL